MHMIDESKGIAAIAYTGDEPWHGLGQRLDSNADLATWYRQAGMDYEVHRSVVEYKVPGLDEHQLYGDRHVLYRDDNQRPLSVVGKDYKIVQPRQVMDFFVELVKNNRFEMEVAGVLDGGRRVWALARVNDGSAVIGHDIVRPYVLLATSYDTSMSTTAKFTSVRVVCHNTLTMAAGYGGRGNVSGTGQTEVDETIGSAGRPITCVRVPHTEDFDPKSAQLDLGIALDTYEAFMVETRRLARTPVDNRFVTEFLRALLPTPYTITTKEDGSKKREPGDVTETRGFKQIMSLFGGEAIGSGMAGTNGTAWQLLNAVTQHVDHQRGRSDESRLRSAWFGEGERLKNDAFRMLVELTA